MRSHFVVTAALLIVGATASFAQSPSPNGVKTLAPEGAIKTTGTWDVGTRAGDFVYVAGMRGIDPKTNNLVQGDEARIRQAFLNMKLIAESEGASLHDCVRIVVYVTDMFRFRPIVNKVQEELWGKPPYPPRTIVEVHRLNQDDIMEVEGTFYTPAKSDWRAVRLCRPHPQGRAAGRPAVQVLVKYETVLNLKNVKALLRRAGHRASARGLR